MNLMGEKSTQELLIRLDERTASIKKDITDIKSSQANLATREYVDQKTNEIDAKYKPTKKLTEGFVTIVLIAVIGAMVGLVVISR